MRRLLNSIYILALLIPLAIFSDIFPIVYSAPQSSYNGINAAEEMNQFKQIPTSYPTYDVSGDDLGMEARFSYAHFDDLPGIKLYLAVDTEQTGDNGYILIHEQDVATWIGYYGRYQTVGTEGGPEGFVDRIKSITPKITVDVLGKPETFYNHAKIAANAGGMPGRFETRPAGNGNWRGVVVGIEQYDDQYKHSIGMELPSEATVGQSVNISLSTTDGSYYILRGQRWTLTIESPNGSSLKLMDNVDIPVSTHDASRTVSHTFNAAGTYTIKFEIEDASYHNDARTGTDRYSVTKQITIAGKNPDPDPDPDPGPCTMAIAPPMNGRVASAESLDPTASGVIRADSRGSERFDVLQGIPTSESLYVNAFGLSYLNQNEFREKTGKVTYSVPVEKTYLLTWTEILPPACEECPPTPFPRQESVTIRENVAIERNYAYWQIDNLEVYALAQAQMTNYALPGGTVTLAPAGYTPPTFTAQHSDRVEDHVQPAPCQAIDLGTQTIPGGNSRPTPPPESALFKSAAEARIGKVRVKNDSLTFNGSVIMDGAFVEERTTEPGTIPNASLIGSDVLYRSGLMIPNSLRNHANTPSTGTIQYRLLPGGVGGGSDKQYPINGINTVTVHTPTVMYPSISDDKEHNQKINPAAGRSALILERPFTIYMPTSGQHRNIPGYGNRDYEKYITIKQVYFPFDVYDPDEDIIYEKNQWITVPVSQKEKTFTLPVWVDEGFYDVHFRSFAENWPTPDFGTEVRANLDLTNHVAINTVQVDVVGRLYDFRITDISDLYWETVFRKEKGSAERTSNVYYVGSRDIDGNLVGNRDMQGRPVGGDKPLTLPIRPSSHTEKAYSNWGIKTGYQFRFEVKTKGNMFGKGDAVRIIPTFDFVTKDGSERIPVDLYYHDYTNKRYFIRIGSDRDELTRTVQLDYKYRDVDQVALQDTARFMDAVYGIDNFLQLAKRRTNVGTFWWMIHPYPTRTLHGPKSIPSWVDPYRALGSKQTWYGEYSLPAGVYVVPQGTDLARWAVHNGGGLTDKSSIFLKDGYIIVNFQIETIRNEDTRNPYLRYYPLPGHSTPYNNQWRREGFQYTVQDHKGNSFEVRDGDVVFYHADSSSYNDIGVGVTH